MNREMESPLTMRDSQDARLGNWHPAQRPDTYQAPDGYDGYGIEAEPSPSLEKSSTSAREVLEPIAEPTSTVEKPGAVEWPLEPSESQAQSPLGGMPFDEKRVVDDHSNLPVSNGDAVHISSQQDLPVEHHNDDEDSAVQHKRSIAGEPEASATILPSQANRDDLVLEEKPSLEIAHLGPSPDNLGAASDSHAFAMLGSLNRTDSFPDVPPMPNQKIQPHGLFHSQAEDIMEDEEEDIFNSRTHAFPSKDPPVDIIEDLFGDSQDYEVDDFDAQTATVQGGNIATPPDEEARYDEGVPLVPSNSQKGEISNDLEQELAEVTSRSSTHGISEDHFFDELSSHSTQEDYFRPQPIDRKTTSQVLDSMRYAPHSETHDGTDSENDMPSFPDLSRQEATLSSSTPIAKSSSELQPDKTIAAPRDEDLAAMWQAALGDDELLVEESPADPSSLFEDDGEGFLQDDNDILNVQPAASSSLLPAYNSDDRQSGSTIATNSMNHGGPSTQKRYMPSTSTYPHPQSTQQYGPQPSFPGPGQTLPPVDNGHSSSNLVGFQAPPRQQLAHGNKSSSLRPQMQAPVQSFSDKSKGGYTSPYDLPMDVTRPKKRNYTQQLRPGTSSSPAVDRPPPPPRSSSMFTSGSPVVETQPPLPGGPGSTKPGLPAQAPTAVPKHQNRAGSFFEELPSVKPRPPNQSIRPSPPVSQTITPPLPPPGSQSHSQVLPQKGMPASTFSGQQTFGLVPPERASLYDNVPHQSSGQPTVPAINSRYSPAPTSQTHVPPSRTRYAVSPSRGPRMPPSQGRPFQPRTSSPLAQNEAKSQRHQQAAVPNSIPVTGIAHQSLTREAYEDDGFRGINASPVVLERPQASQSSPPISSDGHAPMSSPSTPSNTNSTSESEQMPPASLLSGIQYQEQQVPESARTVAPPRRSQTQSPGAIRPRPFLPPIPKDVYQRPASVNDRTIPQPVLSPPVTGVSASFGRTRGLSQSLEYIRPSDGRENDSLERWKGCPILRFGFGGTIVTTFPKEIPRYASGHSKPLMKCSPGEVKIQSAKTFALDDNIRSFPGPLKTKNKKKEVLDWLQHRTAQFEELYKEVPPSPILPDRRIREEEKIVLWRILRVLVEFDGVIEGKADAEEAVRLILLPAMAEGPTENLPPSSNTRMSGISRATGSSNITDPTAPQDLEELRKNLLRGNREKAVWHALDRRMWAHAMLISSTMDKSIWKQVLQEFIRQEVRSFGENTESLAALYQIFAGSWEESVDELVPPSARAGLQFVSKAAGPGPMRNALDGLDRWRETLTLALSNRSQDDGRALVALGRLLAGYGRVEAAHTCFIFARSHSLFGGADDPATNVTLLGVDHLQHPDDFSRDIDSILLTEIYDFTSTVLASTTSMTSSPHLQAYRLYHALLLAENGYRSEAQQYCEAITSALKSTTKRSLYYHDLLFDALEELVSRLRQAPTDNSSSWMSKPSLDKVSGSFFSKVNQFIAGDDSDADSAVSGKGTNPLAGPFRGVSGDTPNISRSSSSTDLYGSYPSAPPLQAGTAAPSRYAPGGQYAPHGQYTPRSSLENNGRPSQEYRRPSQHDNYKATPLTQQPSPNLPRPSSSSNLYHQPPQLQARSAHQPQGYAPGRESYLPTSPLHPEYMPEALRDEPSTSLHEQEPYQPTPPLEAEPSQHSYRVSSSPSHQPSVSIYEPSTSSYLPPQSTKDTSALGVGSADSEHKPTSTSAYQNPTYASDTPYVQAEDDSPVQEKPKKKSFIEDDDDDFVARAAAVLKQEKAQKDREADEAFRKAAEADGKFALPHYTLPQY